MPGEAPPRESQTREALRRFVMGNLEVCSVHVLPLIGGVASERILCFVTRCTPQHLRAATGGALHCLHCPALPCIALFSSC